MKKTSLRLEAPWPEVRELLKENNIALTDEDLQYQPGNEDELIEKLSKKLNMPPAAVKTYIESVSSNTGRAG
jgi:hypothetical protein